VAAPEPGPDDGRRSRPPLWTPEAKALLRVWCVVTLLLLTVYALVLLLA
jgi:hypothetical protein